jgi:hypothetical protein
MLYSSTDLTTENQVIDANSYPPFKLVDSTIVTRIIEELDENQEGIHTHLASCSSLSILQPHARW